MSDKIINPETEYFIVSFNHTDKTDKYITLWRPSNAGYCYPIELAGKYNGYEDGYHNSDGNIPIPIVALPKKFIVKDGRDRLCVAHTKQSIAFFKAYL
jgi:hypothetical protein